MELNHHIMAKATTDAILAHFKDGSWKCAKKLGTYFYRTNVFADFPAPDASFIDEKNKILVSFEFKPPTETKRGILTGLGQAIAYLDRANVSYLVCPKFVEGFDICNYLKSIYNNLLKNKVSVGLITYNAENPSDVEMVVNVDSLYKTRKKVNIQKDNRFWAKHQDLPLPLFDLILHYFYMKKMEAKEEDPYAECWKKHMVSPTLDKDLEVKPAVDLNGNPIKTMAGDNYVTYNKYIIENVIKKISDIEERRKVVRYAIATERPSDLRNGTWDNNYQRVRRYILAFFHQINVIDSNNEITSKGIKLHQIALTNGVDSKIYRDNFAREILITGCHFDLIVDFDRMFREKPSDCNITQFLINMEDEYERIGNIKRNPGRKAKKENRKPFLQHERTLWKYLNLMDEKNVVHWKRIIEVCTLPEL